MPATPPDWVDILERHPESIFRILSHPTSTAPEGKYRHWDTLRRITPPEGISVEEWWAAIKMARRRVYREIPLLDLQQEPFRFTMPDPLLAMLHKVDREASGHIQLPEAITNEQTRDRYIQNSLIEEAFTSSLIEGAVSTREEAKEMIRSGRSPINQGERMILNNYQAMQEIRTLTKVPLTPALVYRIHEIITRGTLPAKESYLRQANDGIAVYDNTSNLLLHQPPPAASLEARIEKMCDFANDRSEAPFIHPVLRAIILHFWLAYDHPFIDGNGRTARALFYWSMLSQGFWLLEYVSISTMLKKAPAKYGRAFLYTETDDNDLTYFLLHQLNVLSRAIDALKSYLKRKVGEVREAAQLLKKTDRLNHRQLALMSHALRYPTHRYTVQSHQRSHQVVYQTARKDLLDLVALGLLDKHGSGRGRGKAFSFTVPPDLPDRLRAV